MTKKVYLVDTENVNTTWKELLPIITKNDRMILFYTANSPRISYEDMGFILKYPDTFEMMECYTGNNGLDFQLVSYLGYLLKTAARTEYIIVSNDTGYDAAIKFWLDRERFVSRLSSNQLMRMKKELARAAQEAEKPAEAAAAQAEEPAPAEKKPSARSRSHKKAETPALPAEAAAPVNEAPAETAEETAPQEAPAQEPAAAEAQPPKEKTVKKKRERKKPAPKKAEEAEPAPPAEEAEPEPAGEKPSRGRPESRRQLLEESLGSECQEADRIWIGEMLAQYDVQHFARIHSDLQRKYGQDQGVALYKRLRTILRRYYAAELD